MKIFFRFKTKKSSKKERKDKIETEIIIPGIAQPETEKNEMKFKSLLFKTLIEKLVMTERIINISDVMITILSVLTFNLNKSMFEKYSGN